MIFVSNSLTSKINVAARGEYYSDANQVIITTGTPNGFQTFGYSINLDYIVMDNLLPFLPPVEPSQNNNQWREAFLKFYCTLIAQKI